MAHEGQGRPEIARRPVVTFDHNSVEHAADPVGSYRALRTGHPVAWTQSHGGYWVLSDYASVFAAARDDATFSSQRGPSGGEGLAVVIPKTPMHLHIPIEFDPPDFRKYRNLINPLLTPAAVERLHEIISGYTTRFIDDVIEHGACDFAEIIGVPSIVTVHWLGLDTRDWRRYSEAHRATLAAVRGSAEWVRATTVDLPYLSERMRETITARRADPRDDVISHLVQQRVDDRPLSDDEVFSMVELLMAGGVGTTASLMGQSLVWLHENPQARKRLIDQPGLVAHAVEEFLRYFSPTQALARTVTADVEFRGCPMREGDRVLLSWASANRDPQAFDDPDELDIDRWPNRHTAFGVGVHRCVGSHLGRALARELLTQILARMPDYRIDMAGLEPFPRQGTNTGWRRIPATFTPGPRLSASRRPRP